MTLHLWFSSYWFLRFVKLLEYQKSSFTIFPTLKGLRAISFFQNILKSLNIIWPALIFVTENSPDLSYQDIHMHCQEPSLVSKLFFYWIRVNKINFSLTFFWYSEKWRKENSSPVRFYRAISANGLMHMIS